VCFFAKIPHFLSKLDPSQPWHIFLAKKFSRHHKTGDGEYGENTADGTYEGYVEVVFPPHTLNKDDFERIVSDVEMDVSVSADIKVEGPSLDEDEEFDE
jgi:hypothetical protein